MALVKKYLDLTSKSQKEYGDLTVVLMQCGSFYEVYALCERKGEYSGSPISDVSRICDLHIASKSASVNGKPVVMAGFGLTVLDKYVRKLQEAGYTIVVYDQDTQTSNT
jgi:DNA mismatch repair protein MutS